MGPCGSTGILVVSHMLWLSSKKSHQAVAVVFRLLVHLLRPLVFLSLVSAEWIACLVLGSGVSQTVRGLCRSDALSLMQKSVRKMKTIQIYDRPMCCSTGICGPEVDPVLPRFAADLEALRGAGNKVERYNLSQQPQMFIQNPEIHALISTKGTDVLPVVMVDGRVVSQGIYPSREMLTIWTGGSVPASVSLPIADQSCCSGAPGCC